MGKSKPKVEVVKFHITLHIALAWRVDLISGFMVGDKLAWEGRAEENTIIVIDQPELFGGIKEQGGVECRFHWLRGDDDQELTAYQAGKLGRTFDNCPGFREVSTVMITEPDGAFPGAYLQANQGTLPNMKFHVAYYPGVDWFVDTAICGREAPDEGDHEESTKVTFADHGWGLPAHDFDRNYTYGVDLTNELLYTFDLRDNSRVSAPIDFTGETKSTGTPAQCSLEPVNGDVWLSFGIFPPVNTHRLKLVSRSGVLQPGHIQFFSLGITPRGFRVGNTRMVFVDTGASGRNVYTYNGSVFTSVSGGASIPDDYADGPFIVSGDTEAIAWSVDSAGTIRAFTITPSAVTLTWTSPSSGLSGFVYSAEHNILVLKDGTDLVGYDMTGFAFTEIWRVTAAFSPFSLVAHGHNKIVDRFGVYQASVGTSHAIYDIRTGDLEWSDGIHQWGSSAIRAVFDDDSGSILGNYTAVGGSPITRVFGPASLGPLPLCAQSNPVHAIRDFMINEDYGMGTPEASIDDAAFRAAAQTVFDEGYCIAFIWLRQLDHGTLINEILSHIDAVLFVSPATGLWTIKLIRDDYDFATLRELTPGNCRLTDYRRQALGETVNYLTVSYTKDDGTEEAAKVALMDPANISAQNNIVQDDRNYYMFRSPDIAMQAARRDLRSLSYPLASMNADVDHEFWDVEPGEVLKLSGWEFPDGDRIETMAVRVIDIDRAHRPDNGEDEIRLVLTEDIFALPDAEFQVPDEATDLNPALAPTPMDFVYATTLPYMWTVSEIDPAVLDAADENADVFDALLGATVNDDANEYIVLGEAADVLGNVGFVNLGRNSIVSRVDSPVALTQEAETTGLDLSNRTRGPGPVVGSFLIFGEGADADQEIAVVLSVVNDVVTIKRGVLDTTPKDWPELTPVWIVDLTADIVQNEPYPFSTVISYKPLTVTSLGVLAEADAITYAYTTADRPRRPLRPANVVAEGVDFGTVDARGLTNISVTVAERDRLSETTVVQFWDAAHVTPEVGQTISLQALDDGLTLLNEVTGLSGAGPHNIPVAHWGANETGWLKVVSVRGGVESLQGHLIRVLLSVQGEAAITLPVPVLAGQGVN